MAAGEDDKDLREVKAVLRGLQRIGRHGSQVEAASKNLGSSAITPENPANPEDVSRPPGKSTERAPSPSGIRSGDAESWADERPVQGKRLAALALAMLAAGTVIVLAGDLFLKYWPSSPSSREAAVIGGGDTSAVDSERAGAKISTPTLSPESSQPVRQADRIDNRAASPAATTA